MRKKGFTLIELLAVIVILTIIALITIPLIMDLIDKAKKKAFESMAYGIIEATELDYAKKILKGNKDEVTYNYDNGVETPSVDGRELSYKGDKPKYGKVTINSHGKILIIIYNEKWCARKDFDESKVTVTEMSLEDFLKLLPDDDGEFVLTPPDYYVLAKDSDFEYIEYEDAPNIYENNQRGYYHYIGTDEYVIIPNKINGNELRDYYHMFEFTEVKGVFSNNTNITDMSYMFYFSLAIELELRYLNTSNVTNMEGMFSYCKAITLDLSNFKTSNVTNMSSMFEDNLAITLDLSSFNTSNVTAMNGMFANSKALSLDLSNFDTSKVTTMYYMFQGSAATHLNLRSFNTSNVTNMSGMFFGS